MPSSRLKTGISGEKHKALDGLKEGDQVITGPFQSVRTMKDATPSRSRRRARGATPVK
jgi:hypothetical protein